MILCGFQSRDTLPNTLLAQASHTVQNLRHRRDSLAVPRPSQPQTPPNIRLNPLLKLLFPFPPHPRRVHIRRALIIRLSNHAHHTDQDLLHALYRAPALGGLLVVVRVVAGRM